MVCITFSATSGVHAYYPTTTAVIAGHKYYGRCLQKAAAGLTPSDSRFELWADDTTNIMIFSTFNSTDDKWKIASSIKSLDTVTASSFAVRTLGGAGSVEAYRKEHLVIDLTAAFGEGNEPSKAWCEQYPLF